jgi:subtilisin family serine protease
VNKAFITYLSTFGLEITPDDDPDEHYAGFRLVQPIPLSPGEPPMIIPSQLVQQLEDAGFEVEMNSYVSEPFEMARRATTEPNDPLYFTKQKSYMDQIFSPDVWNKIHDADDAKNGPLICIIDTGLDCNHVDLNPNCEEVTYQGQLGSLYLPTRKKMLKKQDIKDLLLKGPPQVRRPSSKKGLSGKDETLTFNTAKTYLSMDGDGHGSFVAGIIAASGNNRRGVSGMVWNARMVGCTYRYRYGAEITIDKIVKCLTFCKDVGAKITVNSWGKRNDRFSQVLFDSFNGYQTALHVAAAGNHKSHFQSVDPKGPNYFTKTLSSKNKKDVIIYNNRINQPAVYSQSLKNVISIGAMNERFNDAAIFSNYGDGYVDIFAPGVNIASTLSM